MATYSYPTNTELIEIAQDKIPNLMQNRPIFTLFPIREENASMLIWEIRDNYTGLQQVRGYNGEPPNVKQLGAKQFQARPGVYGEFMMLDELTLTERRAFGTFGTPVDVADLVMQRQDQLLGRRLDRIELIGWTLLATGTFSVAGRNGAIMHTDSYTTQTYAAAVAWSTFTTSTPLADLSAIALLARGHSVSFDARATAYMNRKTFNNLRSNTNSADIGGRRATGLSTINNLEQLNILLSGDNLPNIQIYDDGYLADTTGTFTPFIPDNKVIVVGARPAGQPVGEYLMTRNANNPGSAPGAYMKVIDRTVDEVPPVIEIHDGHSGGPVLYYPSAVVVASV